MLLYEPQPSERYVRRYTSETGEDWDVIDTQSNRRIACVSGFRVVWEEWYQDYSSRLAFRTPQGMTAAAAKALTKLERRMANQRRWREDKQNKRQRLIAAASKLEPIS